MKAKLIIDGKEINVNLSDEILNMILPKNKTGYEKVGHGHTYSFVNTYGEVKTIDDIGSDDDLNYDIANYYSDRTVAENNARADKLMRQLRRFAVEHRVNKLNWRSGSQNKYSIYFDYGMQSLLIGINISSRDIGAIYFDSNATAKLAIDTFREELTWYFMEYKDSL